MAKGKFVFFLRVSTDKQGRSGLGVEAALLMAAVWKLVAEYVEIERGKRSDCPKLAAALGHAKAIMATVVFAKLYRPTRNVDLLRTLVSSGVTRGRAVIPMCRSPLVATQHAIYKTTDIGNAETWAAVAMVAVASVVDRSTSVSCAMTATSISAPGVSPHCVSAQCLSAAVTTAGVVSS
jgi:hypothetical protein